MIFLCKEDFFIDLANYNGEVFLYVDKYLFDHGL